MAYNYKDTGATKLTDDFRQVFTSNIKGKQAITADGLKALAHEKGIKKLTTKILQFPSKDNDNVCIAEATLIGYGWDPVNEKITEVEHVAIGDACVRNCSPMVQSSYIRMAETRAVSRALKNYTNVAMVSVEELPSATAEDMCPQYENLPPEQNAHKTPLPDGGQFVESNGMITYEQVHRINAAKKSSGAPSDIVAKIAVDLTGKSDYRKLTFQEAEELIKAVANYKATA